MTGTEGEYQEAHYGRYWHGYQVVLAPLLTVFDLSQIRWLNAALQIALAAAVLLTLYARGRKDMLLPRLPQRTTKVKKASSRSFRKGRDDAFAYLRRQ